MTRSESKRYLDARQKQKARRSQRSTFKRIGTYLPAYIILGLAVPALLFLTIMRLNGWQVPTLGFEGIGALSRTGTQTVWLYASPTASRYYTTIGGNYNVLLKPWRDYFTERKQPVKELTDINTLARSSDGVLVVPSALALSQTERDAILAFKQRGGSVLATWATGSRAGDGSWSGWSFLEQLGATVVGELPKESEDRQLTLHGESVLNLSQPAGSRIWMGKTTESLLRLKGENGAARFMNWARIPDPERTEEYAITYAEPSTTVGRSVVFGFAETAWESRPFFAYILFDDVLRWLKREPAVVRTAWPNGKQAAQILEMDTEQGFENAAAFADALRSINYKGTFYLLTSVAKDNPDLTRRLAQDFDIGYHGDVHVSFKDQPGSVQEQRLGSMRAELALVLGETRAITGFRAPTEGYDATTERLLQKMGVRHHAADPSRLEGRTPAVVKQDGVKPEDALIVIPRTQRDDINLYWEKLDVARTRQALIDDFELTFETRALGMLSVHSQNFAEGSVLREAMPGFLSHLQTRRDQIWLASSTEVAQWWRDRERLSLSSVVSGKRLDFNLTVKGNQPLRGAALMVLLPHRGSTPVVRSTKIGTPIPRVVPVDELRTLLTFDELEPGNYIFQATFNQ